MNKKKSSNFSELREIWTRLKKNKAAVFGLTVIVIMILLAVCSRFIVDYDTSVIGTDPDHILEAASWEHPFGTDEAGRDLFARIIYGAQYSLAFGIICTVISLIFGAMLGATAAYFGGKVDATITFIVDAISCVPTIMLSLTLMAVLGPGFMNLMLAITVTSTPGLVRIVRSAVLGVVKQEYVEAAHAIGVSDIRIILVHVLPNAMGLIIVNAAMNISGLIMSAASLSFIGMGIQPPDPEWGAMLSNALDYVRISPHVVIFPGLAIVLTALSFNLLGDGLNDALDPRLRE